MIRRKQPPKPTPPPAAVKWQEHPEGFWISVSEAPSKPDSFLGDFTVAVVDLPRGAGARLMAFDDAISVTAVRHVINQALDILADMGRLKTGESGLRKMLRDAFGARGWVEAKG